MHFSPHSLHPQLITSDEQQAQVRQTMRELMARRPAAIQGAPLAAGPVAIALTTVSLSSNFDAYIQIQFPHGATATLLVDSGNANLIIPDWEAIAGAPGYTVLGTAHEPWGCPANVVRGPVQLVTTTGAIYELPDCVFFACTGPNSNGYRTANFGAGRVNPWSANGWNVPSGLGVTLQSPLSYNTAYPYAEFVYAPAETMFTNAATPLVTDGSQLILSATQPDGYTLMDIVDHYEWMSVVPTSLAVAGEVTGWPGTAATAFVDTGGGPVFLSDPQGYIYDKTWPDSTTCPAWSNTSTDCNCVSDRLDVVLQSNGGGASYAYTIDSSPLPPAVQGLSGVFCKQNVFMMNQYGMNIGGISALFNRILVDYAGAQVGMAPKYPNWTQTIEMGASVDEAVSVTAPGLLVGYDLYEPGTTISTQMTVSWSGLPAGATLYIQHGGSAGASVVSWSGPDCSTEPTGELTFSCRILRGEGAAVPLFIYAFNHDYLSFAVQINASNTTS